MEEHALSIRLVKTILDKELTYDEMKVFLKISQDKKNISKHLATHMKEIKRKLGDKDISHKYAEIVLALTKGELKYHQVRVLYRLAEIVEKADYNQLARIKRDIKYEWSIEENADMYEVLMKAEKNFIKKDII